jgi:hypothetical protein
VVSGQLETEVQFRFSGRAAKGAKEGSDGGFSYHLSLTPYHCLLVPERMIHHGSNLQYSRRRRNAP